jgi:hypothetical protein
MSEKQRSALVTEVAELFDRKFVCLDHGKKPRVTIEGDALSCELCCDPFAMVVRMTLAKVARAAADRS